MEMCLADHRHKASKNKKYIVLDNEDNALYVKDGANAPEPSQLIIQKGVVK